MTPIEEVVLVMFQRWQEPELEITSGPTSFGCGPSEPGEWKEAGLMACNEKSLSEITVQKVFADLESFEKNGALGTMLKKVVTDKAADKAGDS